MKMLTEMAVNDNVAKENVLAFIEQNLQQYRWKLEVEDIVIEVERVSPCTEGNVSVGASNWQGDVEEIGVPYGVTIRG